MTIRPSNQATESGVLTSHPPAAPSVQAWDLPTRLFKWSLVILIVTAWISSGFNDPVMMVHKAAGYGVLILVVYRILWGVFGGTTARFSSFVRPPRAVLSYLKAGRAKRGRPYLGHNPAGGLMILGLLSVCAAQALLGLFASDGVTASGPFADFFSGSVSDTAAHIHRLWFYGAILSLAGLHIAVNLFHQFVAGENLIGAMITGRKDAKAYADARENRPGSPVVALTCLVVAADIVYFGITLAGGTLFSAG